MTMSTAKDIQQEETRGIRQIASWGHLAGYLLINAAIVAWGFHVQAVGQGHAAAGQIADHSQAMKNYLIDILADCALLYYCWAGVHWHGGNLETLSGGRWSPWGSVAADGASALPF